MRISNNADGAGRADVGHGVDVGDLVDGAHQLDVGDRGRGQLVVGDQGHVQRKIGDITNIQIDKERKFKSGDGQTGVKLRIYVHTDKQLKNVVRMGSPWFGIQRSDKLKTLDLGLERNKTTMRENGQE